MNRHRSGYGVGALSFCKIYFKISLNTLKKRSICLRAQSMQKHYLPYFLAQLEASVVILQYFAFFLLIDSKT